jgi:hypothetical protein
VTDTSRRDFLATSAAGVAAGLGGLAGAAGGPAAAGAASDPATAGGGLRIAAFRFDVTPPLGHGCCGNWIKPIEGYDDPLEAIGLVLLGAGPPIVLCAVDWTGILNEAHVAWRTALAEAAGTSPERVAVQVVHPHNAPLACLETARLVASAGDLPSVLDVAFFNRCLDAGRVAVRQALGRAVPVTHVGRGVAPVVDVASNRRLLGPGGTVRAQRGSSCADEALRGLPEGLVDPLLRTVAFYHGDEKIAACHAYACHPMSYYGDGRATADFCGLARRRRQLDEPGCTHLYFNGCGGNIGAGKYNDGSPAMRPVLTERIHAALVAADAAIVRSPLGRVGWTNVPFLPTPDPRWVEDELLAALTDRGQSTVGRTRPMYTVAWLRRVARGAPVVLSALHLDDIVMLNLPGEPFVEYQLRFQKAYPERFVFTAGYGDGGPWYIPTAAAYPQGGYEVSVAWSGEDVEQELCAAVDRLMAG